MTDDIVVRLREHWEDERMLGNDWLCEVLRDAAAEIERLRSSSDKWRKIANHLVHGAEYQLDEIRFMRIPLRNPKWLEALRSYDEAACND